MTCALCGSETAVLVHRDGQPQCINEGVCQMTVTMQRLRDHFPSKPVRLIEH